MTTINLDDREVWKELGSWDQEYGAALAPLQAYVPVRMNFLFRTLRKGGVQRSTNIIQKKPLGGYKILDIGCGGGSMAERMAEEGAIVTAVDCNSTVIESNRQRQLTMVDPERKQRCSYFQSTAEELVAQKELAEKTDAQNWGTRLFTSLTSLGKREALSDAIPLDGFDVVLASEVIEHVQKPRFFLQCLDKLLKPNGLILITAPNRTWFARLTIITLAEKVFKICPRGIHDHSKFIKPHELACYLNATEGADVVWWRRHLSQWKWPQIWLRQISRRDHSSESPCVSSRYHHVSTQGAFYVPKLNRWWTSPCTAMAYMSAFRKDGQAS